MQNRPTQLPVVCPRLTRVVGLLAAWTALVVAQPPAQATTFLSADFGTQVTQNIVYCTGATNGGSGTLNLLLDLYQPTDIGTPVPASSPGIVLIHGGSFQTGDKADLAFLANIYASHGYRV